MLHPFERLADQAHDYFKIAMEQTSAFGSRLGAWLLLGNAAALVVVFNGVMDGARCDRAILVQSLSDFTAGLAFAFTGTLIAYGASVFGSHWMGKLAQGTTAMASSEFLSESWLSRGSK